MATKKPPLTLKQQVDFLLSALIIEKLKNAGGSITGVGNEGVLDALGLTGSITLSKLNDVLGTMNFVHRTIKVTKSELHGLSDPEPRRVTIALRR